MTENDPVLPKFVGLSVLEYRSVYLSYLLDKEKFSFQIAADYGKWLLASLILLHGGGLLGLFSMAARADLDPLIKPAIAMVMGLFLGLVSGFLTWLNWLFLASSYEQVSNHAVLYSESAKLGTVRRGTTIGIKYSFWASILVGLLSAFLLPIAACLVIFGPA